MVADFFEMNGWDSHFVGANIPIPDLADAIRLRRADVLAVSVTMPSHLHAAEALISAIRAEPACRRVQILVGGAPFAVAPELAERCGADGHSSDARAAVALGEQLVTVAGLA